MVKYLIKVDYYCHEVKTGGKWIVVKSEKEPKLGPVEKSEAYLPNHNCKKYYESQACEEDETCFWQKILEVKPFSEEEAKRLKESGLEAKCKV